MNTHEMGHPIRRIVSICPSNTEILSFLGLDHLLVGIDDYSDWPKTITDLPRCGPDLEIDIEKVKSLRPDLVLASLSVPGMERNVEQLQRAGLPHLVLNPKSITDISNDLRQVGKAVGVPERGEFVATLFEQRMQDINCRIPARQSPLRLYWEWWPKPVFTPGKRNWLTELSQLAGAVNIFSDLNRDSVQTDWHDVATRDPDYTLIVWTGIDIRRIRKEMIVSRPPWQGLRLAQAERIHILEEGWYCRPSPRLLTGLEHLVHLLYPDHFTPPDPPFAHK